MSGYVKRFIYVLVVGLALIGVGSIISGTLPEKQKEEMTLEQVVTILSFYDVNHIGIPLLPTSIDTVNVCLYGVTDHFNRKVLINAAAPPPVRPFIILHEFYHIQHYIDNKTQDEGIIDSLAADMYHKLYEKE